MIGGSGVETLDEMVKVETFESEGSSDDTINELDVVDDFLVVESSGGGFVKAVVCEKSGE